MVLLVWTVNKAWFKWKRTALIFHHVYTLHTLWYYPFKFNIHFAHLALLSDSWGRKCKRNCGAPGFRSGRWCELHLSEIDLPNVHWLLEVAIFCYWLSDNLRETTKGETAAALFLLLKTEGGQFTGVGDRGSPFGDAGGKISSLNERGEIPLSGNFLRCGLHPPTQFITSCTADHNYRRA